MKPLRHLICIVVAMLLPCIVQAQNTTPTRMQRLKQLFAEKPYWMCVKSYSKCTVSDGEIVKATDNENTRKFVGDIFHFEGSYSTKYDANPSYRFARQEFNDTLYNKQPQPKWTAHLNHIALLNNGSIVMRRNHGGAVIGPREYPNALVLTPITQEQFEKVNEERSPINPTLEEYFHDAQPLPRNIKKILRSAECWIETYENCEVKDGEVRVVGFMVGGGRQTIRRFKRGFKGDYYSIIDNSTGRNKIEEGKFSLHKDDLLYYLDGDIIYIPHEKLAKDGRVHYHRLSPSEYSFEKTKDLIRESAKSVKFSKHWGMERTNSYPFQPKK